MNLPENAPEYITNLALVLETAALLRPTKLLTRTEILARACPVPALAGVYAWFFNPSPQRVPTDGLGCVHEFLNVQI